jgi:N-acetylmuramic acid 6-phosphate (MurNAc-6-P) etherase
MTSIPAVRVEIPVITEKSNPLTEDLDVVGSRGILRLLRQSDAQVFAGWGPHVGLYDKPIQDTIAGIVKSIQPWFESSYDASKRVKVVMAGAGTSGRLSFFCARALDPVCRIYLCRVSSFAFSDRFCVACVLWMF